MKLGFFCPKEPPACAYAVYGKGKALLRNPRYRVEYGAHDAAALALEREAIHLIEKPQPHYLLLTPFYLEGKEYLLLTCAPADCQETYGKTPEEYMYVATDLFETVQACCYREKATREPRLVTPLFDRICEVLYHRFSVCLEAGEDIFLYSRQAVLVDKDMLMMVMGMLFPHLLGSKTIRATIELEEDGDIAFVFIADRTIDNPLHRAIARQVGQAAGFIVVFPPNGIRISMPQTVFKPGKFAADLPMDEQCMSIGAMLFEEVV